KNEIVKKLREGLSEIQERTDLPEQEILSEVEVLELRNLVEDLVDLAYGSNRLIETTQTTTKPSGEAPKTTKPAATGGVISGEVAE
ncbi:MAG: hypothetical protein AAGC68_12930, partial [Verrucomicrobiota bacterium]